MFFGLYRFIINGVVDFHFLFVEYKLKWYKAKLEFYYDGNLVRTIDDPELMKYLDDYTQKGMNIIMDSHPTEEYDSYKPSEPLLIKSFNYREF